MEALLNDIERSLLRICDPGVKASFKKKLGAVHGELMTTSKCCAPVDASLFNSEGNKWKTQYCQPTENNHSPDADLKAVLMNQSLDEFARTTLKCCRDCSLDCKKVNTAFV